MSNAVWPTSLPQYVQVQGYQENMGNERIENQPDAGKPKSRRRFTAEYRKLKVSIQMDADQRATFEEFYFDTLKTGTLPFDWVHPFTQAAATFYFRGAPPAYTAVDGEYLRATFTLWQKPS